MHTSYDRVHFLSEGWIWMLSAIVVVVVMEWKKEILIRWWRLLLEFLSGIHYENSKPSKSVKRRETRAQQEAARERRIQEEQSNIVSNQVNYWEWKARKKAWTRWIDLHPTFSLPLILCTKNIESPALLHVRRSYYCDLLLSSSSTKLLAFEVPLLQ